MKQKKYDDKKAKEILEYLKNTPINKWEPIRLAIAMPIERTVSYPNIILPFIAHMGLRGASFIWHPYARTDVARNHMAVTMIADPHMFTHILFLDNDHNHPYDIAERLCKWVMLDPKLEVVSGHSFQRKPPFKPCWYIEKDGKLEVPISWNTGLNEAAAVGGGCLLISREVFEHIDPPWFKYIYDEAIKDNYPGEDIYFSLICRENGVRLWVDTTVTSPHLSDIEVGQKTFERWYEKYELQTEEEVRKSLLDNRKRKKS